VTLVTVVLTVLSAWFAASLVVAALWSAVATTAKRRGARRAARTSQPRPEPEECSR
jgi:hypothetical protein